MLKYPTLILWKTILFMGCYAYWGRTLNEGELFSRLLYATGKRGRFLLTMLDRRLKTGTCRIVAIRLRDKQKVRWPFFTNKYKIKFPSLGLTSRFNAWTVSQSKLLGIFSQWVTNFIYCILYSAYSRVWVDNHIYLKRIVLISTLVLNQYAKSLSIP